MNNSNLRRAKRLKNDEFYTIYEDIEKECIHYKKYFTDKIIYCNCDDYEQSNFVKYFTDNFQNFGLKKLVATCFIKDGKGKYFEFNGRNTTVKELDSDGSFDSVECKKILEEADIVITNPPFSLFRNFVAQLMEYNKKFLIIGNMNAITYKEIFPLIKENKLWLGCRGLGKDFFFNIPKEYENELMETKTEGGGWKIIDNIVMGRVANACWFTNLEHDKRKIPLDLYRNYSEEYFPKYDNYNAIEVSKVCDIPIDFQDVMAVPITFIDKYCPEQFEILDINPHFYSIIEQGLPKPKQLSLKSYGLKDPYARILIRHKK